MEEIMRAKQPSPAVQAEIEELDKYPELHGKMFPHNGKWDFRGFTQEDYDTFTAGVYCKTDGSGECKWLGGRIGAEVAKCKLEELGYSVTVEPQEDTNPLQLYNVKFRAKSAA